MTRPAIVMALIGDCLKIVMLRWLRLIGKDARNLKPKMDEN